MIHSWACSHAIPTQPAKSHAHERHTVSKKLSGITHGALNTMRLYGITATQAVITEPFFFSSSSLRDEPGPIRRAHLVSRTFDAPLMAPYQAPMIPEPHSHAIRSPHGRSVEVHEVIYEPTTTNDNEKAVMTRARTQILSSSSLLEARPDQPGFLVAPTTILTATSAAIQRFLRPNPGESPRFPADVHRG